MEEKDLQHAPCILSLFCKVWLGYLELFGFLAIINMQAGKTGVFSGLPVPKPWSRRARRIENLETLVCVASIQQMRRANMRCKWRHWNRAWHVIKVDWSFWNISENISEKCKSASHFEKKTMVKAWSNLLPHFSCWFLMMVAGLQILYRSCATDVWQCWPSLALLRLECLHRSELNEPSNQTDLWSKKSQLDQEKWPFFDAVVNAVGTSSKAGDTSSKFCGAQTASRSRFGVAQGRLQRFKKEKLGISE